MTIETEALQPKERDAESWVRKFADRGRRQAREEKRIIQMDIEITNRCHGGCLFCFSGSTYGGEAVLPRERVLRLIDEGAQMGLKQVLIIGGEPLLIPDWQLYARHVLDRGMRAVICSAGDMYTEKVARTLVNDLKIQERGYVTFHLETLNQGVYDRLHLNPRGFQARLRGLRTLLDAGFPPTRIYPQMVLTRPAIETIEETIDWYVDEIGVGGVIMYPLRFKGFGREHPEMVPTLSELRRAYEHRAKRLGEEWLRIAVTDCSKFFCHTMIYVQSDGQVLPCGFMPDFPVGNVFERNLAEIVEENRALCVHDFEVHGPCATCENNLVYDLCRGCRAHANTFLGDYQASDPLCWMNPEAWGFCPETAIS